MNKQVRKEIAEFVTELETMKERLESMGADELQHLEDGERESFDNLSEGFQQSEKGERLEISGDALAEAVSAAECAVGEIAEILDALERAAE